MKQRRKKILNKTKKNKRNWPAKWIIRTVMPKVYEEKLSGEEIIGEKIQRKKNQPRT